MQESQIKTGVLLIVNQRGTANTIKVIKTSYKLSIDNIFLIVYESAAKSEARAVWTDAKDC